jgi:hypothetical protein
LATNSSMSSTLIPAVVCHNASAGILERLSACDVIEMVVAVTARNFAQLAVLIGPGLIEVETRRWTPGLRPKADSASILRRRRTFLRLL